MELDSVYQLKQLCKRFYERKDYRNKTLVQRLDALANERPWAVRMKKKHFDKPLNELSAEAVIKYKNLGIGTENYLQEVLASNNNCIGLGDV